MSNDTPDKPCDQLWADFATSVKPLPPPPKRTAMRAPLSSASKPASRNDRASLPRPREQPRAPRKLSAFAAIKTGPTDAEALIITTITTAAPASGPAPIPPLSTSAFPLPQKLVPEHPFGKTMERKLRNGDIRIDAKLDLHGLTQDQAYAALNGFIAGQIQTRGRILLVITGKGRDLNGVLRNNLPNWLKASRFAKDILSIRQAAPKHGKHGAFYVILKKTPPYPPQAHSMTE